MTSINVFIETGEKKVFAGAIDWPGWCRSGRNEAAALETLLAYAPRYANALRDTKIEFRPPADVSAFDIVERHEGNATTDFGAPAIVLDLDSAPFEEPERERLQAILEACWRAFDAAVKRADGKELRKGPRGGGRELEEIVQHVLDAEGVYLNKLGWKPEEPAGHGRDEQANRIRQAMRDGLKAAVRGELPDHGPRGGSLWPPRYFVRRTAWHALDHAWEIEDRSE